MKKFTITLIAALAAAAHAGPMLPSAIPMPAPQKAIPTDNLADYEAPGCWRTPRIRAAMMLGELAVSPMAVMATGCSAGQALAVMLLLEKEGLVVRAGDGDWKMKGAK